MQFKTKLGLVDIPNDEVMAASRDISSSAIALCELEGPLGALGVARGCLSVSGAEAFCAWLTHMTTLNLELSEAAAKRGETRDQLKFRNYAAAFSTAHIRFRRHMADESVRQPTDNVASEPTPRTEP